MTQPQLIVYCSGLFLFLCLVLLKARFFMCAWKEPIPPVIPEGSNELKTWRLFFRDIFEGTKPFELRKNDRDFRPGDIYYLREWLPEIKPIRIPTGETTVIPGHYTGSWVKVEVTYVLDGKTGGPVSDAIADGFCVWGFKVLEKYDAKLNLHLNDRGLVI